jgi:hypothetical protein
MTIHWEHCMVLLCCELRKLRISVGKAASTLNNTNKWIKGLLLFSSSTLIEDTLLVWRVCCIITIWLQKLKLYYLLYILVLRVINNVSYIVILLLIVCDHDDVYMCCVTKKNGVLSAAVSFCAVLYEHSLSWKSDLPKVLNWMVKCRKIHSL